MTFAAARLLQCATLARMSTSNKRRSKLNELLNATKDGSAAFANRPPQRFWLLVIPCTNNLHVRLEASTARPGTVLISTRCVASAGSASPRLVVCSNLHRRDAVNTEFIVRFIRYI